MKWIFILILFISCTNQDDDMRLFVQSLSSDGTAPINAVRVILITGQSNALGAAFNSDALASEMLEQPNFKIWSKVNSQFENLDIPINNLGANPDDPPSNQRHGLELGLSVNRTDYYSEDIYLIKHGVGGTSLVENMEGGYVYEEFWNNFVIPGINDLISQGKTPYVQLVFAQGEYDGATANQVSYGTNFPIWASKWRSNLGNNLPIIDLEINEVDANYADINTVKENQELSDSLYKLLDNKLLPRDDDWHWNYSSMKLISNMVYEQTLIFNWLPITSLL